MAESVQIRSVKMSKEKSEESYSKTSVSSSSVMSRMESEESVSSIQRLTSTDDSFDSLMQSAVGDKSALMSQIGGTDLSLRQMAEGTLSGSGIISSEKSTSIKESEDSFSYKKEETSKSYDVQESSKSISMQSAKEEVSMKSTETSSATVMKSAVSSASYTESVSSDTEEKVCPVYVVIMDYTPREGDSEGLPVKEGEEVEVVDSSRAHKWRVKLRTTAAGVAISEGTVPSCYLEKKEHQSPPMSPPLDAKMQVAASRRERVMKELVESEEDFARDMQYVVNNYMREMESKLMPKELRDQKDTIFTNFKAISDFHNNVLMKGVQYYANEPTRLGKTFLRLERDFDKHVAYCRDEPEAQQLLLSGPLKEYFDKFSRKLQDEKILAEHLKLPIQRINDYQLLLKELIKYTARLKEDTLDLERALDFMQAIPQRIADLQFLNSMQGYRGNLHKLGRILKHGWFDVTDGANMRRERYVFLFKGRIFITDCKRLGVDRSAYLVKHIIKLAEVEIVDNADDDELKMRFQHLRKNQQGYPFTLKAASMEQKDEWLKEIQITAIPQGLDDLGEDEPEAIPEEPETKKMRIEEERMETKVEVLEDFEAYEEMHTVITESVRSGSLTSLDDFHSALEDDPSLCYTASDLDGGPGRPRFTKPLRARSCVEGAIATLECEVAATPQATVAWLKNNAPLMTSDRVAVETDGAKQKLLLKSAEGTDGALYTIIASNIHGTVSCSAPFSVHSAPETLPPSTPGGSPMPYGPVFLEKLRDIELQEGTSFRVCIIVQGEPVPKVKFYKEDQEIKSEGRIHFVQENKECFELVIENVLPEDRGKYSCVAESSAGQNVTSCNFTVTKQKVFFKTMDDDTEKMSTPELTELDVAWVKDSKDFESSERFKVSIDENEDTVALVFQHVTPDDAGMYTCVASTSGGKISCSAELTVQGGIPREPEAPKVSASATEVEAKEGGSALLELTATGFPKPKVTWSKDGEEVKAGDKYAILLEDEETYTMAIKNVNKDDSGKYSALAKNELGESAMSYNLKVTCPPKFAKQMKDTSVMIDETIKFEVEVEGTPEPTITWCKDGQTLSEGGRTKMVKEGNIRRLVIEKARAEDSGNYSCTITNSSGTQAGFGALLVNSPPKFIEGLKDTSTAQDQDATFTVKVSGQPKPSLKWTKDGSQLTIDGSHVLQKDEGSDTFTLIIKKTTQKDIGKYTCEISNQHGQDSSSGKLTVKGKPTFSQELKDRTVNEGEKDVDLTVKVAGTPAPKITWYIGDVLITESSNYKIISDVDAGSYTLRIKEVKSKLAGKYKCEAENDSGKKDTSAVLTVTEEIKTSSPTFQQGLKDTEVKEGETVNFTVKIAGEPKPSVQWNKDDAELKIDGKRIQVKTEAEDSLTLIIDKSKKEDAGKYSCVITNSSGSKTSSSKLTVTESATFRQGLKDTEVKEGETINLTVKIGGIPKPTAKWNKDGAELTIDGKRVQVKTEAEDSLTLVIDRANKDDAGKYSCVITNSTGSETTSSKLTVKVSETSPTFQEGLKDKNVKEGETVEFKVKFAGLPKPTAKWNKDGAELTIDGKRVQVKTEAEDSLTLVLNKTTKDDTGKYSCVITNTVGSETTSSKLTVSVTETSPTFQEGLKDKNVKEGETVEFNVKFTGKPTPTAKWNKDGAELTIDGKRVQVKTEAEDSLTLVLNKATKDDTGKYSCVITNTVGSETTSSKLTVSAVEKAPTFQEGLKDKSIKEEETVEFKVKFSGQPKPTAKWNKDGAELTIDGKRVQVKTVAEDSLTLVLNKATKEDAGKYSCVITNTVGSETTSSKLTVSDAQTSPTFQQGLKDTSVKEGDTAHFTVKIAGKPKPTSKWNLDGAELTIDGKHIQVKTEAEDSLTLIIDKVTKEDEGKYSCVITNSLGSQTSSGKLSVSATPVFTKGLEDTEGEEGGIVKFNVKFEGRPEPVATWKKDGVQIDIDGKRVKVSIEGDDSLTLVIKKVEKTDVGQYSCEITNAHGSCTSSGKLSVTGKPVMKKKLEDKEAPEGDCDVELVVEVKATPAPNIKWYLGDVDITSNEKYKIISDDSSGVYKLAIKKVTPEMGGKYRCEATNSGGKADTSANFTVLVKPSFLKDINDQTIIEGEALVLETSVKGHPMPEVTWMKGTKAVTASDRCKLSSDGSTHSLTIKSSLPEDSGTYTCKARNKAGEVSQKATVTVKSKRDTEGPRFITHLADQNIVVGDAARLEVKITGKPPPQVTWYKNEDELQNKDEVKITTTPEENLYTLTLTNLAIKDSARYTCKAVNENGEATESAVLTIKEPMAPAMEGMTDMEVAFGSPVRIRTKITGFPTPEITWLKDNKPIKASDMYQISHDAENKYALSVKSVKDQEVGVYSCVASNSAGKAEEKCKLSINAQVPVFAKDMEDKSVEVGDVVKFQVEVYGYPTPTITWLKGSTVLADDGRFVMTGADDVYTLEVRKTIGKDAGMYCCKAVNTAGEASRRATLKIEDFAPILDTPLIDSVELLEGDQLTLKTKVVGQPTPDIKWYKDGKPLKASNKVKMTASPDGSAELVIDDMTHGDSGTYKVLAVNSKGQAASEGYVSVGFRPKNTKPFVKQLRPVEVVTGSPFKLEAKVVGVPKPTVAWFKNGEQLGATTSGSHAQISESAEGLATIAIGHATVEDAGEYKLTATNEMGEDSSTAQVTVSLPGKKPTFLKELKARRFIEGESGKLETKAVGYPEPTISWLQNGKNIMEGKHCSIVQEPGGAVSLNISKVTKEDGGLYTVVASNKLGKAISEAPVIVVPVVKHEEKKIRKIFEFNQGLMPVLVPEGRPCKLEAQVTTDPKPVSVKWSKDGKDLSPNERMDITEEADGTLKLCIHQMTADDRGRYSVIVSDGSTEIKSEAVITMLPALPGISGNKPIFVKGLEPVKLPEGETLTLQAMLPPDSKCSLKWMKDGEQIQRGGRVQMLDQPDGTVALVIEGATPDDSGKYIVIATNEEGKTRSSAMVAVIGHGFRLPEIVDVLKPATFVEGQPGKLEAKVDGEPKPEVKWMKDGEEVEPSPRIKLTQGPDGKVALEIKEAKPEDVGKYTLVIANVGGETRCSAPVMVNQPPLFVTPLQPVVGVEGFPNKFEAKVTGDPISEVKWLKDGAEIPSEDPHRRQIQLPDGSVALLFDKCTPDDAGNYSCIAKNSYGEKPTTADMKVIGRMAEGEAKSAPAFVTPLGNIPVTEGESFKLEGTISGNPLPDINWLFNDQPVNITENITQSFDGKKVKLSVNHSNPLHAGVYQCRVSNILGDASSKGNVSVSKYEAPKFVQRLSDAEFPVSGPMKLMCRVKGIPDPEIQWFYNGERIEPGLKYSITKEADKTLLVVPRPRSKDSGVYECRAKNSVGEDSCRANITVSGAAPEGEPATFLKKLRDCGAIPGMTAKFTACITGVPKPAIKWFKDGEQFLTDSRRTLEVDPNGVIRLLIRGVKKSDVGTYRVSISNMYGSDTCTAKMELEGPDTVQKEAPAVVEAVDKGVKAGPPSPLAHAPYILKMSDTSLSLGWRPSIPHYPQVPFTYRIEMCRVPDGSWSTYRSGIKDSACDIRDLVPGLDYMFRVRVENKYGVSEPSPYVTAHRSKLQPPPLGEYKPKDYDLEHPPLEKYAAAPRFLRQEEEGIYAIRGQSARVEFWVYGHPQPQITWFYNNVQVETEKYDFMQDRNGQVIMFITRMSDNDVGMYTCKAVNEHGEAQQKIKLMIADTPAFTKRLEQTTIMLRGAGEFVCRVSGTPYPKIKWFKDWHPLSDSSRIKISWEKPDTCILSLSNSILKDCGLYTCTATNVAGTASTSAMLNVEECETEYHILTYRRPPFVKPSDKPFDDHYIIGDELGRGTQGITYHAVERNSGRSFGAKVMHGTGKLMDYMISEMDTMNQLCHPRLLRLWNAYQTSSSLTLAMDMCGGGELLPNILQQGKLTESMVAYYIKQALEGLEHMHEKNIAHLGLTIGDLLVTRLNSDSIKIGDFGLATRLYSGREYVQEFGHPEFVAPEVANKQPVTLAADMWSIGIITYLLLTGDSPFLRENDRETLKLVQRGKVDFFHDGFVVLSDDARDFVANLLTIDPSKRLDVTAALKHKWLELATMPDICDELTSLDRLKEYYKKWKSWYANASCRRYYRRRTLESCFTHPSRMIYPPDEEYTPPSTPDRELDRTRVKPSAFDDVTFQQRIEREPIDVRSESQYQNGPDTFLLPLRDPDFPVRIRKYLRVGANRSPILARHLKDKHWGYSEVAVKERRKFMDVMDEEINDEKRGVSRSAPLRLRHEVGTVGSGYDHIESRCQKKKRGFRMAQGIPPYFREKIKDVVIREDQEAEFNCCVTAKPPAQFSWFRNDGILIESSRIIMKHWSDGTCSLRLNPAKAYDFGVYKCVARNSLGIAVCRARLNIGGVPGKPEPPHTECCSDAEVLLTWMPPKFEGFSSTLGYTLEYKETNEESWTKVASNIAHEFFLVRNLKPSTTYHFRLSVLNKFGWGEFSSPSEPILTRSESAPKLSLSKAQKYQQDMTESGQPLILDEPDQIKLDYVVEEEPIEIEEGKPTELYNFISEVSRGRFSVVVKVWVKKLNTAMVAKACEVTSATAARVQHEYEMLRSLRHEKIASLQCASSSPTSVFLVMEKLSGIDVITYLSSRPLYTEETVSRIIHQVIDALEYLHFRSICYFELQPDNVVMVDRYNPYIKLVDMGSAQYIPEGGAKVQVKGSLEYLAPELLKDEEVQSAADIWGVGVLTYILLSGVSPFAGENDADTKNNVLYVRYHFDHLYKEVSQEATHFLMQVFKRTPQKRPTAEECLENKWLLPNEFMIKKREHAEFLSHHLREFSEQFHSLKSKSTPSSLLNIFGTPLSRSVSRETEGTE